MLKKHIEMLKDKMEEKVNFIIKFQKKNNNGIYKQRDLNRYKLLF